MHAIRLLLNQFEPPILPRGVYPELHEILRYAQNDRMSFQHDRGN